MNVSSPEICDWSECPLTGHSLARSPAMSTADVC